MNKYEILEVFADAENKEIAHIIKETLSDESVVYDVRIFAEDSSHYRDLACENYKHARHIFDAIETAL